jgi:molybdopterin synthase sulfur carrier subunit
MRVLYFAWLRERIGAGEEELVKPAEVETVGQMIVWLRTRGPAYAAAFAAGNAVRCAVNQEFAGPEDPVGATDEVAFFPPVTGG